MASKRRFLDPASPTFISELAQVGAEYHALRSLYERISKDTGWVEHPNRDALLVEIAEHGKMLASIRDAAIQSWFAGG